MTQTKHALTPPDLVKNPQLATVELLANALELTKVALLTAHPELSVMDYIPEATDWELAEAELIMSALQDLLPVLKSYRERVQEAQASRDSDPPF